MRNMSSSLSKSFSRDSKHMKVSIFDRVEKPFSLSFIHFVIHIRI